MKLGGVYRDMMDTEHKEEPFYRVGSESALRVENLSKIYVSSMGKVVSLRNVSFSVNIGEFVSVVGPSGSGKSTLLNMIGALDRPTSGKVFIHGIDIFSLNDSQIATLRNNSACESIDVPPGQPISDRRSNMNIVGG